MLKGREQELQTLAGLMDPSGPAGIYLWGVAGIGKSSVLQAFAESVTQPIHVLDCATVEPTERGFRKALHDVDGDLTGRILVLDNYESFGLMDSWLQSHLRPKLGADLRLLISGRTPPTTGWRLNPPDSPRMELIELGGLPREAALDLLSGAGMAGEDALEIIRLSSGHPLTLQLAASAGGAAGFSSGDWSELMHYVSRLYLEEVTDPAVRRALEAASIPRRLTRSLLAELMPGATGVPELFESLAELSFSRLTAEGLRLHEAIRQALATTLRASDPERFAQLRRRAWRHVRNEMGAGNLWKYTADLIYLVDNPVVREAFFPSSYSGLSVRPAEADEHSAIREITALHEPDMVCRQVAQWLERAPDTFHVVTDGDEISGYYQVLHSDRVSPQQAAHDSLLRGWMQHKAGLEVARAAPVLFIRRWLARATGESPSPVQAACWLDLKRSYMELRPELRRVYLTVTDLGPYAEAAVGLGFQVLPEQTVNVDGVDYHSAMLDFGSASVDGWITRLVAAELGILEGSLLDVSARQLVFEGRRIDLTQLEFGVVELLLNRSGKPVSRDEMLERVWGSEAAGSNVVDVIIAALRRKLPAQAGQIETVRGVGYRYCVPSS